VGNQLCHNTFAFFRLLLVLGVPINLRHYKISMKTPLYPVFEAFALHLAIDLEVNLVLNWLAFALRPRQHDNKKLLQSPKVLGLLRSDAKYIQIIGWIW